MSETKEQIGELYFIKAPKGKRAVIGTPNSNIRLADVGDRGMTPDEINDFAARVCRECNAHADLVAALKEARKWTHQMNAETHARIDAALAKAGVR